MEVIKPIYVMNEAGLYKEEKSAVLEGIAELLEIAEVSGAIDVTDFGEWRNNGFKDNNGELKEYQSVEWYLKQARDTSRNSTQLNAAVLLQLISYEPWRESQDHYDVTILHSDMYAKELNFVIGYAQPDRATVLSVNRFRELSEELKFECIKTETMHEVGHVFKLPSLHRKNLVNKLTPHCNNVCVMRQGMTVPNDWIDITKDRLNQGPFCDPCKDDVKDYFKGRQW